MSDHLPECDLVAKPDTGMLRGWICTCKHNPVLAHDPMCPREVYGPDTGLPDEGCQCDPLRAARADGYARGRADTLDKAIAAVRGLAPHLNYRTASGDYASARVDIDDAIAALEALR